jgi:hypothetical protein
MATCPQWATAFPEFTLNPALLPTAHEMNTGTGKLEEREQKWRVTPPTSAFVSPVFQRAYADRRLKGWLGSPKQVEALFVKAMAGNRNVPPDYIVQFQARLQQVFGACLSHFYGGEQPDESVWNLTSPIMRMIITIKSAPGVPRRLSLFIIFLRPCAERFSFFRVALSELSRICIYWNAELYISDAMATMRRTIQTTWPEAQHIEETAPQVGVKHNYLVSVDVLKRYHGTHLEADDTPDDAEDPFGVRPLSIRYMTRSQTARP